MEKITDWEVLWKQLVDVQNQYWGFKKKPDNDKDFWKDKAKDFDKLVKDRWSKPDPSREFIIKMLKNHPRATVLDIGAGTGAWSMFMAPYAANVTALEPSDAMGEVLIKKMDAENINNIRIIKGNWPDIDIDTHDFVFASHSMYGVSDFKRFVSKMIETAKKFCFLLMRVPFSNAVMSKAAEHVWGQPYDSPNFQVAYNLLLQMDIYPNILMEPLYSWKPWSNNSMEEALMETKNRLGLKDNETFDDFLKELLGKHLEEKDGKVFWPVGNRSVLAYWDVE